MFKVLTVVGARPQFIKAAMVSAAIQKTKIREVLVHTGQHYDTQMSEIFFKELKLPVPKFNLNVGSHPQGKQTALMLERIEEVLVKERPQVILVYGDTNSTLSAALAGAKLHIPIAHVESGMRSFNKIMPEEINRVMVDHMSSLLFCSTKTAVSNLEKEGIVRHVFHVGDVMIDALSFFYHKVQKRTPRLLKRLSLKPKKYSLATIHRAENTDDFQKIKTLFDSFDELASEGHPILLPLHPRTKAVLKKIQYKKKSSHFRFVEPMPYLDMILLQKNAEAILTDSGGIQKEAYFFGVPTMTLRDQTEWIETVQSGINHLTPIQKESIKDTFYKILTIQKKKGSLIEYGDGNASAHIVETLLEYYE